jgi:hypothetical protein
VSSPILRDRIGAIRIVEAPQLLNETSTIPASYGERFVKRRGLFCLAVTFVAEVWSLRKPAGQ